MNKIILEGKVMEISPYKNFQKKGKEFSYRTIMLSNDDDAFIAANYWYKEELPAVGTNVKYVIYLSSERNNKNQELFFHKINLLSIYETTGIPKEI